MSLSRITLSLLSYSIGTCSSTMVEAEDAFPTHLRDLASTRYTVRQAACQSLVGMCRQNPDLLDALADVAFNPDEEIERRFNVLHVIQTVLAEIKFIERGAIGLSIDNHYKVTRMVDNGPAHASGIKMGWKLVSIQGREVEGMSPDDVYDLIHATPPGTELVMEFELEDGKRASVRPVVVARSTIRADEEIDERKKQFIQDWLSQKRKAWEERRR